MKTERRTMHLWAKPATFFHAKYLRNNLTSAEKILWGHLQKRQMEGVKFRNQHPINNYVVDFYCHELKLCIEVDGPYHDDPTQVVSDQSKDQTLNLYGIQCLRYANHLIENNLEFVLNDIRNTISRLKMLKRGE